MVWKTRKEELKWVYKKINKKNGTIFYEGGLCFEQFLSLEKCMVCLPSNYRELSKNH